MNTTVLSTFKPLYNGNIAAMSENLISFPRPLLFSYAYDQLNRLIQMRTYKNNSGSGLPGDTWHPVAVNDYNEDITYDANGNILNYKRYGNSSNASLANAQLMDSLSKVARRCYKDSKTVIRNTPKGDTPKNDTCFFPNTMRKITMQWF